MTLLVNRFNAPAGKEADLLAIAKSWKEMILQAPGCKSFSVYTDQDSPTAVVTVEEWNTRQDHEAFNASLPEEAMAEAMKSMTGMPESTYLDQA